MQPRIAALLVGLPLAAFLVMAWPSLHFVWTERAAYSHGYLVLGIALWLAYREGRRAPLTSLKPSLAGCAILALVVIAALVGKATDVALLVQLAVPAAVFAALWGTAGLATAGRFLVPAAYMVFAMPIWDVINEPLREITVVVVGTLTRQSSIPALIDGNFIRIPSGTFEVEGGCSGLHYLIVGAALGSLYGLVTFNRWLPRCLVLAISCLLALIANWIRVFVVIVAGHLTEMQHYLVTVDHYTFGWLLFLALFVPLFVVGHRLDVGARGRAMPGARERVEATAPLGDRPEVWGAVSAAILLAVGAWLGFLAGSRPAASAGSFDARFPAELEGWSYDGAWDSAARPVFLNADAEVGAWYAREQSRVSVYLAHYAVQNQGKEAVFYANHPSGVEDLVVNRGEAKVTLGGSSVLLTELEVADHHGGRRIVWYGYRVAGKVARDPIRAKLYQVLGALQLRWDAQVIVASSVCDPDCGAARDTLARFGEDRFEELLASFDDKTKNVDE